jgi:hypothetical protein
MGRCPPSGAPTPSGTLPLCASPPVFFRLGLRVRPFFARLLTPLARGGGEVPVPARSRNHVAGLFGKKRK